ncbi:MAG: M23 family metallopeptidase [Clostridia bacterium]|nr:M23 family metallopeptidase [Clostridia bacterium]
MKKSLIAALAAASLLFAAGAFAEDSALPGVRVDGAEAAATPAAQEVQAAEVEEAVVELEPVEEEVIEAIEETAEAEETEAVSGELEITRKYRWFISKYKHIRGRTVEYYDDVYAYNHGDYYLTPFASDVSAEYFVVDDSGAYAVAPIVLDITDAMRTALYGADVGETSMLYGQYCERMGNGKGATGFTGIHEGIDFVNEEGCPLYAIMGGEVTRGYDADGTIAIYNEELDCTLMYLHCENSQVRKGDIVEAGALVGYEGNKNSGSPYTHVEFRYGRHAAPNAYRDVVLKSDCPYPVMQELLGVVESGRQPVTVAAVYEAQRMREEAEAAQRALEAEAAAQENAEPEIELIDTLPEAGEGYGFGEEAEVVVPEATLPPA